MSGIHIIVSAQFCEFKETSTPGVTMMSTMLFSDQISSEVIAVGNKADVATEMARVFEATKAAHPGRSFYVSQIRHPRCKGRAFAGYKNLRHRIEYDAKKETVAPEPATA